MFDASSELGTNPRYRGMNPKFVQQVWAKRRAAEAEQRKLNPVRRAIAMRKIEVASTTPAKAIEERPAVTTEEIVAHFRVLTFGQCASSKPTGREIIKKVCWENQIEVDVVLGKSRSRKVVAVRQAAMAAIYCIRTDYSLPKIGRLFNRDHTTVIYSLMKQGIHDSQTGGNRTLPKGS